MNPTPFRHSLRVRYAECDAQKVVFHSRYSEYVDVAMTEFIRALGFGSEAASGEFEYQLVRQTIEWKAPARFDQIIEMAVDTQALGNTSFTIRTTFRIEGEPSIIATAETVYVMVEQHTLRKMPLSDLVRAALAGATSQT